MWLSFNIVYTSSVTRFLSQHALVALSNIWTAVISFLWLKKKKKNPRLLGNDRKWTKGLTFILVHKTL